MFGHCPVLFRTSFRVLLDYLLNIGTTNRTQNAEGTSKMKKSLIASLAFIAQAGGLSTAPVMVGEFNDSSFEKASFATLTPAMAARGQRFYVGG